MKVKKLIWALVPVFFISCVATESDSDLAVKGVEEKTLTEIFEHMEKLPAIEDPDPEIVEPNYHEIFGAAFKLKVLEDLNGEDPMPDYLVSVLKSIGDKTQGVASEVKEKFAALTLNGVVAIMDPRVPLDPEVEQLLRDLWVVYKEEFSVREVPVVDGLEEMRSDHEQLALEAPVIPFLKSLQTDGSCVEDIYALYAPGARSCSNELAYDLGIIESNYLRRVAEAEERFRIRNKQLENFTLEQLPVAVSLVREGLTAVRNAAGPEEVKEIRENTGFLAAMYAYHLRNAVPEWHQYGLQLNEWYYYKELEVYAELRVSKEDEANAAYTYCIDWVNTSIIEEVEASCPGEEPILY